MPSTLLIWRRTRRPIHSRLSFNPVWSLVARPLLDLYIEALDLLVQCRQWNLEILRCFGLIPMASLQAIRDDTALDLFHQIKERSVGLMVQKTCGVGAPGPLCRQ